MPDQDGPQFRQHFRPVRRIVAGLQGIFPVVVQFENTFNRRIIRIDPFHQAVAFGAEGAADTAVAREGVVGVITDAQSGISEYGYEVQSVDELRSLGPGQAGQFGQIRINVYGLGQLSGSRARRHDQQGNAVGLLEIGVFGSGTVIAQAPAVVAPEDDYGIVQ